MKLLKDWDHNLRLRFFGELATGTFSMMLLPFMAVHFANTLGASMAGALLAFVQFFSLSVGLVGGALADRIGRKPMIMWGQYIALFGYFTMLLSQTELINSQN
ncbi:MAG: hypothetical protein ACRC5C_13640, partial [Bacilli bacterium]